MGCFATFWFVLFPCLLIYFENVGEAKIMDVMPVMIFYLFVAVILLPVYFMVFKKLSKSIAMVNVTMAILLNFELLAGLFTEFSYKNYVLFGGVVLLLAAIGFIMKHINEDFVVELNDVFCVVLTVLILVNGIPTIPTIVHKLTVTAQRGTEFDDITIQKADSEQAPNLYYLIFDEYGGSQNLKEFMDFDNSEFLNSLRDKQFNVSEDSYNMESVSTETVVANLLNLSYVADGSMPIAEQIKYLEDPNLYFLMDKLGYEINICSHTSFLDNRKSTRCFHSNVYFENLAGYQVLKRSIFIHLYEMIAGGEENAFQQYEETNEEDNAPIWNYTMQSYRGDILNSMEYYMKLSDIAVLEKKPQFSIGYFQAPHYPFVFQADGTPTPSVKETAIWEPKNYLPFLQWTNGKIEEIVSYIIDMDSNSIIIIQSDHGARYVDRMGERGLEVDRSKEIYQHNILNCVYYKGELFDIGGESGINTLRKVLNSEFDLDLEMIKSVQVVEN